MTSNNSLFAKHIVNKNEDIHRLQNEIEQEVNSTLETILGADRKFRWKCNKKSFILRVSKHLDLEMLLNIEENTGCKLKKYLNDYAEFEYMEVSS